MVVTTTEAAVQAVSSEDESDGDGATIEALRETLSRVRLRCQRLETRLDGEGAVLLAAFRRHHGQMQLKVAQYERLAYQSARTRDSLVERLHATRTAARARAAWDTWRISMAEMAAGRALAAQQAAERATAELANGGGGEDGNGGAEQEEEPPALPTPMSRRELYRYSYEALIDQVRTA